MSLLSRFDEVADQPSSYLEPPTEEPLVDLGLFDGGVSDCSGETRSQYWMRSHLNDFSPEEKKIANCILDKHEHPELIMDAFMKCDTEQKDREPIDDPFVAFMYYLIVMNNIPFDCLCILTKFPDLVDIDELENDFLSLNQ